MAKKIHTEQCGRTSILHIIIIIIQMYKFMFAKIVSMILLYHIWLILSNFS
nr:MAG TPA_asm: hypothetical protein [Caudoviricetes sp.]